jgi:S1-C subfamily serine protease
VTTVATSRTSIVAIAAAGLALVVAGVAVAVTLTRSPPAPKTAILVEDGAMTATDVVALIDAEVTTGPGGRGLAFAAPDKLGLRAGDIVHSIAGRPVDAATDLDYAVAALAIDGTTGTLYLEVQRGKDAFLARHQISGDLQAAWSAKFPQPPPPPPGDPTLGGDPIVPTVPVPDPTPDELARDAVIAGITKIDDFHYAITRKAVDDTFANPTLVAKGARVIPSVKNGKADGFKLYAIRPSSIFAKLGFANGDTIHRVNGNDLSSMDKALEVYTKLKDSKKLIFEITRRGKPVTLELTIKK